MAEFILRERLLGLLSKRIDKMTAKDIIEYRLNLNRFHAGFGIRSETVTPREYILGS